jgi:hypothetical protein
MSRDAADQILAGLGAAYDRIAAVMYGIDSHPALEFLRNSTLSGNTAARWDTLRPEVDLLWSQFAALGGVLEQARTVRGGNRVNDPRWTDLTRLLREPVIGLDAAGLLAEGSGSPPTTWVRVWELAEQLEKRCGVVAGHLSEVDGAWSAVAKRLTPVTEAVDEIVALAADLSVPSTVDSLRRRLAEVHDRDMSDPLAAAPGGRLAPAAEARLSELGTDAASARQRLAELARLRDGYPQRLAAAATLVDEVEAGERAVAGAYQQAVDKISAPGLPPAPAAAAVLRSRTGELGRLATAGDWSGLADALGMLEQSARRARDRAAELRAQADGLLARRDELRGRLEAYRAKASAKGLGENGDLTERYLRSRELLYTAPCDLRAATRAVYAYQQTLAALTEESPHHG